MFTNVEKRWSNTCEQETAVHGKCSLSGIVYMFPLIPIHITFRLFPRNVCLDILISNLDFPYFGLFLLVTSIPVYLCCLFELFKGMQRFVLIHFVWKSQMIIYPQFMFLFLELGTFLIVNILQTCLNCIDWFNVWIFWAKEHWIFSLFMVRTSHYYRHSIYVVVHSLVIYVEVHV